VLAGVLLGYSLFAAAFLARGQLLQLPPEPELSPDALALILRFEVGGGQEYYERFLSRPTVPPAASGLTIGIGYDCGYNSSAAIRQDWRVLPARDLALLVAAAGLKGDPAREYAARHQKELQTVRIPWNTAFQVFNQTTLSRFYLLTRRTFPGFDHLHPNPQGSLVSLVFNRGSCMVGESRREMRAIRGEVPDKDYASVAEQIRSMKRLWPTVRGLLLRRDAEADLVLTAQ